jgi:ATP-dependent RNA helicase SUPV3L1/SUV3
MTETGQPTSPSGPSPRAEPLPPSRYGVTALLGPTNTGKTFLAIERMLAHASGMIGFPLRLLARENYDRAVRLRGAHQVALITGEEKIIPAQARYFFCTVESMPLDRQVEFLAVDEIQLCGDPERGHIFTDRLLYARGISETLFLGAETIKPLLQRLVPEAEVVSRPRFSTLSYAGDRKLTRLPPRSAIVAFSANDVYAIAELIRRQRGGAAVVLGALSPRTRNAQVALFEEGEVDYLVATDAIGMGLNLNLNHVAFARLEKFDGRQTRPLGPAEIAQIAGRAGRHMSDGTFGTTADVGGLEEEVVEAVENHRFDPLRVLAWRNRSLDFTSPSRLMASLEETPEKGGLFRAREAEDQLHLAAMLRDPLVMSLAHGPERVALLWEVCQIPDFQKTLTDQHNRLLASIYASLLSGEGRLKGDFIAERLKQIDRVEGDIDALTARISQGRVWTYITHRADWLDEAAHWQEQARAIEDRLSDALHERLTQRFVDRRAALLLRGKRGGALAGVKKDGEVVVEGEPIGRLRGFRLELVEGLTAVEEGRAALAAARRILAEEIPRRVQALAEDDDGSFLLEPSAKLTWRGQPVARLVKGKDILTPAVLAEDAELLDAALKEKIRQRLEGWLGKYLRNRLAPLYALSEAKLEGEARGLAFQVVEGLGLIQRRPVAALLRGLSKEDRKTLGGLGLRFGAESLHLPALLKPEAQDLKSLLWWVWRGGAQPEPRAEKPACFQTRQPEGLCEAQGYRIFMGRRSGLAVRADALERLMSALFRDRPAGPFSPLLAMAQPLEGDREALARLLPHLGFRRHGGEESTSFAPHRRGQGPQQRRAPKTKEAKETKAAKGKERRQKGKPQEKKPRALPNPDSPFAKLAELYGR